MYVVWNVELMLHGIIACDGLVLKGCEGFTLIWNLRMRITQSEFEGRRFPGELCV